MSFCDKSRYLHRNEADGELPEVTGGVQEEERKNWLVQSVTQLYGGHRNTIKAECAFYVHNPLSFMIHVFRILFCHTPHLLSRNSLFDVLEIRHIQKKA